MNFKDIYKSANDDIHADRGILNDIIAKSETKHRPHFKVQYVYSAAAIAVVISVSLLAKAPSDIKSDKKIVKNTEYSQVNLPDESKIEAASESSSEIDAPSKSIISSNGGNTPTAAKKKTDITAPAPQSTDSAATESIFEETAAAEQAPAYKHIASNDILKVNVIRSAPRTTMSGGGAAVYSQEDSATEWVDLPYSEYCEYIGMDITKAAALPKDMSFTDYDTVSVQRENGEITSDEAHFGAVNADGSKFVQVITSKLFADADNYLSDDGYEKSSFNETEAVVIGEADIYRAYFMKDDTSVSITAHSFSEDELKDLLTSLTK